MYEKNIAKAFVAVCAKVENVKRDTTGQVGNQKYKYATLESVLEVLHPLWVENKLACPQFVVDDVLYTQLVHESGELIEFGKYNLGAMTKSQDRGSAITYARRYMLCSIFGIAQEDDDGAADKGKPKANLPTNGEKTAQAEFGTSTEFKKYYADTIDAIGRLPSKDMAGQLRKRIDRIAKVDEQYALNATEALDLKLDELHMQG